MSYLSYVNYRNLFLLNGVVAILYGAMFFLLPKEITDLNGFIFTAEVDLLSRSFGTALITIGGFMLALSFASEPKVLQYVSIMAIIGQGVGAIAVLYGILLDATFSTNIIFMSNFVVYLIFVIGFGYLFFTKAYEQS